MICPTPEHEPVDRRPVVLQHLQHLQRLRVPDDQPIVLSAGRNELAVLRSGNTEDVGDVTLELSIALFPAPGEKQPFWFPGGGEVARSRRRRVLRKNPFDEVAVLGDGIDVGVADCERGSGAGVHAEERGRCGAEGVLRCEFAVDLPLVLGDALAETVGDDVAVNVCSVEADFVCSDVSTERNRDGALILFHAIHTCVFPQIVQILLRQPQPFLGRCLSLEFFIMAFVVVLLVRSPRFAAVTLAAGFTGYVLVFWLAPFMGLKVGFSGLFRPVSGGSRPRAFPLFGGIGDGEEGGHWWWWWAGGLEGSGTAAKEIFFFSES